MPKEREVTPIDLKKRLNELVQGDQTQKKGIQQSKENFQSPYYKELEQKLGKAIDDLIDRGMESFNEWPSAMAAIMQVLYLHSKKEPKVLKWVWNKIEERFRKKEDCRITELQFNANMKDGELASFAQACNKKGEARLSSNDCKPLQETFNQAMDKFLVQNGYKLNEKTNKYVNVKTNEPMESDEFKRLTEKEVKKGETALASFLEQELGIESTEIPREDKEVDTRPFPSP